MSKDLVIALDAGSQSSRALLFDARGEVLAKGQRQHAPMKHPEPGAVEQDPADLRGCLNGAVRDCLGSWGGDPGRIAAASLTTQRSVVLATDAEGRPLQDAVSWLDRRRPSLDSETWTLLRVVLKAMGEDASLPRLLGRSLPRLWRERNPQLLKDARWIVPLEAWLHHGLVGRMAVAPGGLPGAFPFDVKSRDWDKGLLFRALGFERGWVAEIVEAGQEVGRLTPAAAQDTGLPAGLPLFACGGDKQAEALGSGVLPSRPEVAGVSLGTGSAVSVVTPRPHVSLLYKWLTNAFVTPGAWTQEYMVFLGMWTARWFAEQFARDLVERAAAEGTVAEALLCEEAAAVPAGSEGVVTWPRWSPGVQHPHESGTLMGLRERHTRAHAFRSLVEGILMDLRRGIGILEGATGTRVRELRVGGGGSRSDLIVQMLADVTGLPVRRPQMEELSAKGAAIVAAVGAGLHSSAEGAVAAMVPDAPVIEPDPVAREVYDRLYGRVFEPGLRRMGGVFSRLGRLQL